MLNAETYIIKDESLLNRLFLYSEKTPSNFVVYDTETDSVIERKAHLYGFGVCFNDKKAFYVPWRKRPIDNSMEGEFWWNTETQKKIIDWLEKITKEKKLIGHNIIFDVLVTKYQLGIDLTHKVYSDTILLKHTLDEEKPHGLKEVAVKLLGPWADQAQKDLKEEVIALGGKWIKNKKDMFLGTTETLGKYCCWDVLLTYLLFVKFDKQLREEGLEKLFYEDEIMELYKWCTIPMKDRGFPIDVKHFNQLKTEIKKEIDLLEGSIINDIYPYVGEFLDEILNKKVPLKPSGNFPKFLANELEIPLPVTKAGQITLSAKAIELQKIHTPQFSFFYDWLLNKQESIKSNIDEITIRKAREKYCISKNKKNKHLFNLGSNAHLIKYFIDAKNYKPLTYTEKKKEPKIDVKFIEYAAYVLEDDIAKKLIDYKKLRKISSTYIDGILSRQIDGIIYTNMLQFGTTSGRYSSQAPNCQNLPRVKDDEAGLSELVLKYVNAIKKGFIAPEGYDIVNADFSQLEPTCFAHMSGDEKLRDVFHKKEDLYARIAIDVFKLEQYSANKKDPNYLKKLSPTFRDKAKIFALAVVYGAEESRISEAMKVDLDEASKIIKSYKNSYPDLKKYMEDCDASVLLNGYVKTIFGRVRHLQQANDIHLLYDARKVLHYKWAKKNNLLHIRRKLKNLLNNSKNFPIQGLAAHIVNRAMVAIAKELKKRNINAYIALQVHDEITNISEKKYSKEVAEIVKHCMENTTKISVPLVAEPLIAQNWAEAK